MFRIHPRTLLKAALVPAALLMAAGGSPASASQAAAPANVTSLPSALSPDSYYTMRLSPWHARVQRRPERLDHARCVPKTRLSGWAGTRAGDGQHPLQAGWLNSRSAGLSCAWRGAWPPAAWARDPRGVRPMRVASSPAIHRAGDRRTGGTRARGYARWAYPPGERSSNRLLASISTTGRDDAR
jgi:hypothetical protein